MQKLGYTLLQNKNQQNNIYMQGQEKNPFKPSLKDIIKSVKQLK